MYTQYVYTLKTIVALPKHMQKAVLKKVDDDFIKFLIECIINLIQGNFDDATEKQFLPHLRILEYIIENYQSISRNKQRSILASSKGLKLLKTICPHIYEKFGKRRVGRI